MQHEPKRSIEITKMGVGKAFFYINPQGIFEKALRVDVKKT